MKRRKAVSEIFSSLIVTLVVIAFSVPLILYFNSIQNIQSNNINNSFQKLNNALTTKFTVIIVGNTPDKIFLYNYGSYPANIQTLIVGNTTYPVSIKQIMPNQLIPLSQLSPQIPNKPLTNATMIIEVNGNYYAFRL